VPRLFSGPGDPPAWVRLTGVRRPSLGTGTPRFQTESRPNVPLHHPSSAGALETLYLIKAMFQKSYSGNSRKTGLTCEFSRITCQNLVDESSLIHFDRLIVARSPLSRLGNTSAKGLNAPIDGIHTPRLALSLP
jgi:hypothetical protein